MTDTFDFVVVGAGIAGASVAYELAAHGSVAVLERETIPGYHTTGRSAAVFTEAYERGPVRALTIASREHLESPPEDFSPGPLLSPLPVMLIGRRDQEPRLAEHARDVAGLVPVDRLDGEDAVAACPVLRPGYVAAALLEPGSMEIDVHALHQGFLSSARRRGARVLTSTPVTGLKASAHAVQVVAGNSELEAGVVVIAAGAWADRVAGAAGARPVGLTPLRRTAFTFPAPERADTTGWPMVVDIDEDFYFKPEGAQFMGSPAEETPMHPHDARAEEADVALAIERINTATTLDIHHVRRTWAGLRTFAPDRSPVVGFDPEVPGVFWLAGQGGFGIMTSPAMARLAAGLITEQRIPEDLAEAGVRAEMLSPGRFRS